MKNNTSKKSGGNYGCMTFEELYESEAGKVRRYIGCRVPDEQAAEDINQQVWVKVYVMCYLQKPHSIPIVYLWSNVKYRCVDWHNRQKRMRPFPITNDGNPIDIPDSMPNSLEQSLQKEEFDRLHNAISSLPELDQSIIKLRYWGNMSGREIADSLRQSKHNFNRVLRRVLTRLREMLQDPISGKDQTVQQKAAIAKPSEPVFLACRDLPMIVKIRQAGKPAPRTIFHAA